MACRPALERSAMIKTDFPLDRASARALTANVRNYQAGIMDMGGGDCTRSSMYLDLAWPPNGHGAQLFERSPVPWLSTDVDGSWCLTAKGRIRAGPPATPAGCHIGKLLPWQQRRFMRLQYMWRPRTLGRTGESNCPFARKLSAI